MAAGEGFEIKNPVFFRVICCLFGPFVRCFSAFYYHRIPCCVIHSPLLKGKNKVKLIVEKTNDPAQPDVVFSIIIASHLYKVNLKHTVIRFPFVLCISCRLRDRPVTRLRAESLHARILIAGRQRSDQAFESEPFARRPR